MGKNKRIVLLSVVLLIVAIVFAAAISGDIKKSMRTFIDFSTPTGVPPEEMTKFCPRKHPLTVFALNVAKVEDQQAGTKGVNIICGKAKDAVGKVYPEKAKWFDAFLDCTGRKDNCAWIDHSCDAQNNPIETKTCKPTSACVTPTPTPTPTPSKSPSPSPSPSLSPSPEPSSTPEPSPEPSPT